MLDQLSKRKNAGLENNLKLSGLWESEVKSAFLYKHGLFDRQNIPASHVPNNLSQINQIAENIAFDSSW